MAELNIPTEIKDKSAFPQLKKIDRQIICAAVLMGLPNQDAFRLFHPEFLDGKGKLNDAGKKASSQFWNYGKVKDYREQYEKEVAESLGQNPTFCSSDDSELTEEEKKNLKGRFANKVYRALGQAEGLEELKDAADLGKTAKILKEEENTQELPRRYLPCRCGECDYRSFVESYVETGEIENSCLRCKALDIAKENGFRYDPKTLLRPKDDN